jgi:hypothetical protein
MIETLTDKQLHLQIEFIEAQIRRPGVRFGQRLEYLQRLRAEQARREDRRQLWQSRMDKEL